MTAAQFIINPADMPNTADVVVIGGGPAGTAALWAIERAAPGTRTVLLEQSGQLAAGSSLASLENFRTCWPTPCLMRLMTRSIEVFQRATDYLDEGTVLGIRQQGYLYVGFNQRQADDLRRDVEHLHHIGLAHVEYLDADDIAYRFPWLGRQVIAGKYDPVAGWLDSNALVYGYARAARSAQIALNVRDIRICVDGSRVTGVTTATASIAAPAVIIAAGANARSVGRTAGIDIPVVIRPRQSFTTPWRHSAFPEYAPCVISAAPFPHLRPEARDGAIFGWEYRSRVELVEVDRPADHYRDARFPSLTLGLLARQFGHRPGEGFADPRYLRGVSHRAGYYVYRDNAYVTLADGRRQQYESQRAIIDAWPGIDGLFLSVAHVGHGIMASAASGEIIAARVLGRDLPDPVFADFGLDVPWVEHDTGGLGAADLPTQA